MFTDEQRRWVAENEAKYVNDCRNEIQDVDLKFPGYMYMIDNHKIINTASPIINGHDDISTYEMITQVKTQVGPLIQTTI